MVKNSIAAVVACLYVALSAWLVSREGEAYRDALRQARKSRGAARSPIPAQDESVPPEPKADVTPSPPPRRPEPAPDRAKTAPEDSPTPDTTKPAIEPPRPGAGGPAVVDRKPIKPQPPDLALRTPAATPKTPERSLAKLDPIWSQPQVTKKWDLSHLSAQDEMRLGGDLFALITHLNPPARGGPWLERVDKLATPILERRSRKDIEYTFTILDSEAVNAFSHPGGHIYLSRGLFPFLGEDEDAALQFVLAHEIAHVDLRHAIQCLQDPGVQQVDMGTVQKLYFLILPLAYLDKQEFEADRWAYSQVMRLDNSRYDTLKFLRKLKGYAESHDFTDGRARYEPRRGSSPVENHLRAHTAAWKRLRELEAFSDAALKRSR
jgi:hypothetical protein